jgi:hypothetical protein
MKMNRILALSCISIATSLSPPARAEYPSPFLKDVEKECSTFSPGAALETCWINNLISAPKGSLEAMVGLGCLHGAGWRGKASIETLLKLHGPELAACRKAGAEALGNWTWPSRGDKLGAAKFAVNLGQSLCTRFAMTHAMLTCLKAVHLQMASAWSDVPGFGILKASCDKPMGQLARKHAREAVADSKNIAPGSPAAQEAVREVASSNLRKLLEMFDQDELIPESWRLNELRSCLQSGWEGIKAEIDAGRERREFRDSIEKSTVPYRASVETERKALPTQQNNGTAADPVVTVLSE